MPRSPIFLFALVLGLAAPGAARAQDEDSVAVSRPPSGLIEPIAGVRVGFPQKISAFVGIAIAEHRDETDWAGWSLTVEPGLGGGLVGIGRTAMGPFSTRARMQAAVLRTWGDPWLVGPDRTYVGLDNSISVLHVGVSLSGYVKLPEDGDGPGILFSAGLILAL